MQQAHRDEAEVSARSLPCVNVYSNSGCSIYRDSFYRHSGHTSSDIAEKLRNATTSQNSTSAQNEQTGPGAVTQRLNHCYSLALEIRTLHRCKVQWSIGSSREYLYIGKTVLSKIRKKGLLYLPQKRSQSAEWSEASCNTKNSP